MVTPKYPNIFRATISVIKLTCGGVVRIVFIGASGFGLQCLQEITSLEECEVVGVITAPSEFKISYSKHKVKFFTR